MLSGKEERWMNIDIYAICFLTAYAIIWYKLGIVAEVPLFL